MKTLRLSSRTLGLLASLILLAAAGLVQPSYGQGGAPLGGRVEVIAIDPVNTNTVYAGTHGGVFKSTDGGANWSAVNTGLAFVRALAIDPVNPATIYAGGAIRGISKSTDGGANWTAINSGLTETRIKALAIDPLIPTTLYAGTFRGVFKSTDGGANWSSVNTGLTDLNVEALAIHPSDSTTLYAGTHGGGAFKSTDGGANWNVINTGLTTIVLALAIDPANPATVYAGGFSGIYKSTDGGANWKFTSPLTPKSVQSLAIDPANPATLYAGGFFGIYKSTDGGANWTEITSGLTFKHINTLAIDPANPATIFSGTSGAIFKSVDGGINWAAMNSGLTATDVRALMINPVNPATIYAGTNGAIFFTSTDAGDTWSGVDTPVTFLLEALAIDPVSPATIYAGGIGGISKSNDGGANWSAVETGLTPTPVVWTLAIDPLIPTTLYAGTQGGGVIKSTDGGANWTAINSGLTATSIEALAIDPFVPTTLYAGTLRVGVFKSTDGGANWSGVNTGLTNLEIKALAIDPLIPTTLYAGTFRGVFKSTDGGANWSSVNTGLSFFTDLDVEDLAIDPSDPTTLYAVSRGGGAFKSTDGGANWTAANSGLPPSITVNSLAIDPSDPTTLYGGTRGAGVFKSRDGAATWQPTGGNVFRSGGCRNVKFDPLCVAECETLTFQLRGPDGMAERVLDDIAGQTGRDIAVELCRAFIGTPEEPAEPVPGFQISGTDFGCQFCREDDSEFQIFLLYEDETGPQELEITIGAVSAACGLRTWSQPESCDALDQGGDSDRDGVCTSVDNCPSVYNPAQWDSDGDGIGDACEMDNRFCRVVKFDPLCLAECNSFAFELREIDGDTVIAARRADDIAGKSGLDIGIEICRTFENEPIFIVGQDSNGCSICRSDGQGFRIFVEYEGEDWQELNVGEINESCGLRVTPQPRLCSDLAQGGDSDNDLWCEVVDNCPDVSNPDQTDSNRDGVGDACPVDRQVAGDCNQTGDREIGDLTCYVAMLFPGFNLLWRTAPSPCSTHEGNVALLDVNGDASVGISDIVYLSHWLFQGGPDPVQGAGCFAVAAEGCGAGASCQ